MEHPRIVLILNKILEPGVALNTAGHLGIGLLGRISASGLDAAGTVNFQNYADRDNNEHAFVSALPLIVLRAKSGEIRKCRAAFKDLNIPFVDYTNCMVGGTYLDQLERSRNTPEAELEYFGICALGSKTQLDSVTRKFSLWK
jgi:hypothetical protein